MRTAALVLATLLLAAGTAASARPQDHAAVALNILPAGENGSLQFNRNTNDQAKLYDALTPLWDNVTDRDLRRLFKAGARCFREPLLRRGQPRRVPAVALVRPRGCRRRARGDARA